MLDYDILAHIFYIALFGLAIMFTFFKGDIFFVTSNNLIINDDITFNQEPFTGLLDVIYE